MNDTGSESISPIVSAGEILIVDDTPGNLNLLCKILHDEGYVVRPVSSGQDALDRVGKAPPILILLDILMPEMDGFEVLRRLKEDEVTRGIPVIFITSLTELKMRIDGLRAGAVDFINRPFAKEEVLARVKIHLTLRKLQLEQERYIVSLSEEIGLRKLAEERVRLEKNRLAVTLKSIGDAVITTDATGVVDSMNPVAERMTGWPEKEAVGKPLREVFHIINQRTRIECPNPAERVLASGEIMWLEDRTVLISRDGTECAIDDSGAPIRDGKGTILGVIIVFHDHSAVMKVHQDLQDSEEIFRNVFENSIMGKSITQVDGSMKVNLAFARMLGYSVEELSRKDWKEFTHPDDIGRSETVVAEMLSGSRPSAIFEMRYLHRDGGTVLAEVHTSLQKKTDGTPAFLMTSVRDITAQKQAELEREVLLTQIGQAAKMESVGRLAGGVAHDFNNMLSVTLGNVDLAKGATPPSSGVHMFLDKIRQSAERSRDLTRQLLAFARKQVIQAKVLDFNDTVASMLKILQPLIGENVRLEWSPGPKVGTVSMDPGQIDQILANLCVNARDAIRDVGRITLATEGVIADEAFCLANSRMKPGEYILLTVSDDGCGMDKATLSHLFEPFFTTKGPGRGTGLGLATVYGIVKQNLGFINVTSQPGEGTTFQIYLPRHPGKASPSFEPAKAATRGCETILLVEDEAELLLLTKKILDNLGYRVLVARTPSEAIQLVEANPGKIDLLLSDVILPEMNGRELAIRLQNKLPGLSVLFTSGYTPDFIVGHGVFEDGVHFLEKPFSVTELAEKVRVALNPKGQRSKPG